MAGSWGGWPPDSRLLALLVRGSGPGADTAVALHVWDTARKVLRRVPLAGDAGITPNSGLAWSPDGRSVLLSLRSKVRDAEAHARFLALTEGPVIVHRAKDPFLEWDDLGRTSRQRALALVDIATGAARTVLPERRVSSYQMARDGSCVSYQEDLTEKTDYEVIGGSDNALRVVPSSGGEPRTGGGGEGLKGGTRGGP